MLRCILCQEENHRGRRNCQKCNARLPAIAAFGESSSTLDLSEALDFQPIPVNRYANDLMYDLSWAAYEFVEEEAEAEPFLETFDEVQERFEEFADSYESLRNQLLNAQAQYPDEKGPAQALYLCARGRELYLAGIQKVNECIEHDLVEELLEAVRLIMDGSDHVTHCIALMEDS